MLDQETFFKEHYIDPEEFRACGISWEELCAIYDSYVSIEEHLRDLGKDFVDAYLYDIEKAGIHSYRYRTKDPEHLLEKIIRKRSEDPERFADIDRYNYHGYMTGSDRHPRLFPLPGRLNLLPSLHHFCI